uniref:NADH-ubiquinone oxidoreductase chain 6 n=1 Tax=Squalogadus modificatus TaxID=332423 RepID=Q17U86_9TELE|nr:NADH dehydrogenase subunit 6 [Squalogadus modificatus]BAE96382.1 NADH dehydrogenase subunit 6 [Squalogadus modificatus]
MTYVMLTLLIGVIFGVISVASNPSPYFAALGLVLLAGVGCGILIGHGGSFLSLVLFLIYLGGMLVVFAYCAALAAEPYPEAWGEWSILGSVLGYFSLVLGALFWFVGGWHEGAWVPADELIEFSVVSGDSAGVAMMYSLGGGMLIIGAWVLLLALFVVLELARGRAWGTMRAV